MDKPKMVDEQSSNADYSSGIAPGTSRLEILRYLLGSGTTGKVGNGLLKAILTAVVLWFANDKRLQFRDDTSVSELKVEVEKLKSFVAAPPTVDGLTARNLRLKFDPPWPPTNTGKIRAR